MKRIDLVPRIEQAGCRLIRDGGRHDWYHNPEQPIPRHREVKDVLAKHILRKLGVE